jgi:hypothetical protein
MAAARVVVVNACAATPSAARADPALNPYQPTLYPKKRTKTQSRNPAAQKKKKTHKNMHAAKKLTQP